MIDASAPKTSAFGGASRPIPTMLGACWHAQQAPGPKAFLFDSNKCTGCQACELACTIENQLDAFSWRQVTTLNEARHAGVPTIHLSLACNHCAEPPCMEHCPALAYGKDPVTGLVSLDAELCIGCKYCSWACPYDAPRFDAGAGVMTKCTFCEHRQAEGREPACVEQCPTGALGFGDLAHLPGVAEAPGLPTVTPGPSIRFVPWRGAAPSAAVGTLSAGDVGFTRAEVSRTSRKITLRSEWPLVGFSLIAAVLVAAFAASAVGSLELSLLPFLGLAGVGMGLSTLHLGKPWLAWRALLNLRRSWLSREIALVSGFMGLAALHFLVPERPWLTLSAAIVGFAALFAVDRVYDLVRPAQARPLHSADVLLTGALLAGILAGNLPLSAIVGLLKLNLYLRRKSEARRRRIDPRWRWGAVRLGAGFVAPVLLGFADPAAWPAWALAGAAVGELVDRCEFYQELEVPTPAGQMARELNRRLKSMQDGV